MHNDNGERDETLPNSEGPPPAETGTSLVVPRSIDFKKFVKRVTEDPSEDSSIIGAGLPTEIRRVRRGKFFLSNRELQQHGSMRRPIFEYYCHGVVVGETVVDEARDGVWCFAAHNDFDLIPEFQPPSSWPEYTRTPTGWIRADGARRLEDGTCSSEEFQKSHPKPTLDGLLETISKLKRLK